MDFVTAWTSSNGKNQPQSKRGFVAGHAAQNHFCEPSRANTNWRGRLIEWSPCELPAVAASAPVFFLVEGQISKKKIKIETFKLVPQELSKVPGSCSAHYRYRRQGL